MINVGMWIKALRIIPRITKKEWNKLDFISKWLISTRSAVLVMTFISCAIGGIFAYQSRKFDLSLWLICTIGLIMAHATNNMLNDLVDYIKGVDKGNYFRSQYGPQPLQDKLMSIPQLLLYIFITGLIAFMCGAYLIYLRGSIALILFLMGSFFLLVYTFPLKYIGCGELAVLIVWGPLMTGGTYFVITGDWSWSVCLASLPYAIGVTTVLFGKHIDKYLSDKEKKIHTLPVLIGEKSARYAVIFMTVFQYLLVIYLVVINYFSPLLLLVFLSISAFYEIYKIYLRPKPANKPKNYRKDIWPLWFVAYAFEHNRKFGILFIAGLILQGFFNK